MLEVFIRVTKEQIPHYINYLLLQLFLLQPAMPFYPKPICGKVISLIKNYAINFDIAVKELVRGFAMRIPFPALHRQ